MTHGPQNVKLDVKSLTFARHSFDSDWILAMSWSSFLISSSYSPLSLMIFSFLCSICCISLVIAPTAPFCDFTSFSIFWTAAYCKIKERKSTIWRTIFNKHKSNKWTQILSNFGKKNYSCNKTYIPVKMCYSNTKQSVNKFLLCQYHKSSGKATKKWRKLHNEEPK